MPFRISHSPMWCIQTAPTVQPTVQNPKKRTKSSHFRSWSIFLWINFLSTANALIDSSFQLWCYTQFRTSEFRSMLHTPTLWKPQMTIAECSDRSIYFGCNALHRILWRREVDGYWFPSEKGITSLTCLLWCIKQSLSTKEATSSTRHSLSATFYNFVQRDTERESLLKEELTELL